MTPDTIGRYRILKQLGAGGMGEVYLAEDSALKRQVAIKVLPAASGADETADARLVREAQAAATLDHPSVCAIYEVGEQGGQHFIAMQYVEGETLTTIAARLLVTSGTRSHGPASPTRTSSWPRGVRCCPRKDGGPRRKPRRARWRSTPTSRKRTRLLGS